jgi:hypothetical protein
MNSHTPATILALLAEMARCLNQNLAKVNLSPLDPAFRTVLDSGTGAASKQTSNV